MENDQEIFDAALQDGEVLTPDEGDGIPTPEEGNNQLRDETGKFAAASDEGVKPEAVETEATDDVNTDDDKADHGQIPSWRLREVTQERNAAREETTKLRDQLAQMQQQLNSMQRQQPKPEPKAEEIPDIYSDPEGYTNYLNSNFEKRLTEQRAEMSLQMAHIRHGESFEKAYEAARQADPQTLANIRNSADPGEALVRWHKQNSLFEQTGGDLDSYIAKQLEAKMNDPAFQAQVIEKARANSQGSGGTQINLPPTVSKMTGSTRGSASGGMSSGELFESALR